MNLNFLTSLTHAGNHAPHEGKCEHRFPSGRRCRQAVSPHDPHFCFTHAAKADPPATADDLAAEIAALAGDFSSPSQVNHVMSKIFHAMLQHRLTAKEAGVLCYIAQTILQSQRAIAVQQKLDAETAALEAEAQRAAFLPDKLTWNLPPRNFAQPAEYRIGSTPASPVAPSFSSASPPRLPSEECSAGFTPASSAAALADPQPAAAVIPTAVPTPSVATPLSDLASTGATTARSATKPATSSASSTSLPFSTSSPPCHGYLGPRRLRNRLSWRGT